MSEEKLTPTRLVFIPYLIISILFISVYSFVHWLLLTNYEIFEVDSLVEYFLPLILTLAIYFIFLNPRVELLDFSNEDNSRTDRLVSVVAMLALTFPTVLLQETIHAIAGKITEIQTISEINKRKSTKYYVLKNYVVEKQFPGIYEDRWVREGKGKDKLRSDIHIVAPIMESLKDTNLPHYHAWVGKNYYFEIDNDKSESEKERLLEEFYDKSVQSFKKSTLTGFTYLERMSKNLPAYQIAAYHTFKAEDEPIIFEAKFAPFEKRTAGTLEFSIFIYGVCTAIVFFSTYNKPFKKYELDRFLKIPERDYSQPVKDPNYKSRKRRNRSQNL